MTTIMAQQAWMERACRDEDPETAESLNKYMQIAAEREAERATSTPESRAASRAEKMRKKAASEDLKRQRGVSRTFSDRLGEAADGEPATADCGHPLQRSMSNLADRLSVFDKAAEPATAGRGHPLELQRRISSNLADRLSVFEPKAEFEQFSGVRAATSDEPARAERELQRKVSPLGSRRTLFEQKAAEPAAAEASPQPSPRGSRQDKEVLPGKVNVLLVDEDGREGAGVPSAMDPQLAAIFAQRRSSIEP
jgi:hypothetical protein